MAKIQGINLHTKHLNLIVQIYVIDKEFMEVYTCDCP